MLSSSDPATRKHITNIPDIGKVFNQCCRTQNQEFLIFELLASSYCNMITTDIEIVRGVTALEDSLKYGGWLVVPGRVPWAGKSVTARRTGGIRALGWVRHAHARRGIILSMVQLWQFLKRCLLDIVGGTADVRLASTGAYFDFGAVWQCRSGVRRAVDALIVPWLPLAGPALSGRIRGYVPGPGVCGPVSWRYGVPGIKPMTHCALSTAMRPLARLNTKRAWAAWRKLSASSGVILQARAALSHLARGQTSRRTLTS